MTNDWLISVQASIFSRRAGEKGPARRPARTIHKGEWIFCPHGDRTRQRRLRDITAVQGVCHAGQPLLNRLRIACGCWLAMESTCVPSCCFT